MKRFALAIATVSIGGLMTASSLRGQAPDVKKSVVFACNMKAMTPEQRKRHSEVLSPALRSSELNSTEVADGYEFEFPADRQTFQNVAEWVANERLCCPFFAFDIRISDDTAPMTLRITGPDGVKQFIKAELGDMVGKAGKQQ